MVMRKSFDSGTMSSTFATGLSIRSKMGLLIGAFERAFLLLPEAARLLLAHFAIVGGGGTPKDEMEDAVSHFYKSGQLALSD